MFTLFKKLSVGIVFYVCFTSSMLFAADGDLPEDFFEEPGSPIVRAPKQVVGLGVSVVVPDEYAGRASASEDGGAAVIASSSSSASAASSSSSEHRRLTPQEYIMGWVADQYEKKGDWAKAVYFYRHAGKPEKAKELFESAWPAAHVRILFKDTSALSDEKLHDGVSNEMLRNYIIKSDPVVQEYVERAVPAVLRRAHEEDPLDILNIDRKALERQAREIIAHKPHEAIALVLGVPEDGDKKARAKRLSQEYLKEKAFFMAGQLLVPAQRACEALFWLTIDVTFPCARSSDTAQDVLRTVAQPDQYTQLLPEIIALAHREQYVSAITRLSSVKTLEEQDGKIVTGERALLPREIADTFIRMFTDSAPASVVNSARIRRSKRQKRSVQRNDMVGYECSDEESDDDSDFQDDASQGEDSDVLPAGTKRGRDDEGDGRGVRARHEERS